MKIKKGDMVLISKGANINDENVDWGEWYAVDDLNEKDDVIYACDSTGKEFTFSFKDVDDIGRV